MYNFPIPIIDDKGPSQQATHERVVSFVDKMLRLHNQKNNLPPSSDRDKLEREIAPCETRLSIRSCTTSINSHRKKE